MNVCLWVFVKSRHRLQKIQSAVRGKRCHCTAWNANITTHLRITLTEQVECQQFPNHQDCSGITYDFWFSRWNMNSVFSWMKLVSPDHPSPNFLPKQTFCPLYFCPSLSPLQMLLLPESERGHCLTRHLNMGFNKLLPYLTYMVVFPIEPCAEKSTSGGETFTNTWYSITGPVSHLLSPCTCILKMTFCQYFMNGF